MMHLLKSIAYDVAVCMCQLFEYYFYTVYVFFISEDVSLMEFYFIRNLPVFSVSVRLLTLILFLFLILT